MVYSAAGREIAWHLTQRDSVLVIGEFDNVHYHFKFPQQWLKLIT